MKIVIDVTDDEQFDGFGDLMLQAIELIIEGNCTERDNKVVCEWPK